jgi:hypothetical protein
MGCQYKLSHRGFMRLLSNHGRHDGHHPVLVMIRAFEAMQQATFSNICPTAVAFFRTQKEGCGFCVHSSLLRRRIRFYFDHVHLASWVWNLNLFLLESARMVAHLDRMFGCLQVAQARLTKMASPEGDGGFRKIEFLVGSHSLVQVGILNGDIGM